MNRTILLVEDNENNRYLATYLLESNGFRVVVATDGPSAIDAAQGNPPALILLDIHLPGMDGYAVARALRCIATLREIPIVAVTSYAMDGDREKALQAGCNGYIEKPIRADAFVAEIRRFTPNIQGELPCATP